MRLLSADASVIAKWLLKDEEDCEQALNLKNDLAAGTIVLVVPGLARYELASLLSTAVRRGRILAADAALGFESVVSMGIIFCDETEFVSRSLMLSVETGCSLYDCAYLSTAMGLGCPLYTADRRFAAAAGRVYKDLRHVAEYVSR